MPTGYDTQAQKSSQTFLIHNSTLNNNDGYVNPRKS